MTATFVGLMKLQEKSLQKSGNEVEDRQTLQAVRLNKVDNVDGR